MSKMDNTENKYDLIFEEKIIFDYQRLNSIRKVSKLNKITTRQVIKILDNHQILHNVKRKIQMDEQFFDKNDDEIIGNDVMYWAGFIAADGNIMNNPKSRSYFLTIKLSQKDEGHLHKFKCCINTNAEIKNHTVESSFREDKFWKESHLSTIVLCSKYLVNSLCKYNIVPNKSKIYEIPKYIMKHKFINSFIRGYFDGDGSISFRGNKLRLNFYGTQMCLNNISEIIHEKCNIKLHNPFKNRTIYNLEYNGKEAEILFKWLYVDSNIYLDRKYKLIKSYNGQNSSVNVIEVVEY